MAGNVYHGIPARSYEFNDQPEGYLAFLGRITPEKGIDEAIRIALKTKTPLKIAAKIDRVDEEYFRTTIEPLLDHSLIEFIGEIGHDRKNSFQAMPKLCYFQLIGRSRSVW